MKSIRSVDIVIVGAGIAGIATAYYLCSRFGKSSVLLIDQRQPMSFTSAQSGDNYRNWWPHPTMVEFTNASIDLMEDIARSTSNLFNMTRRGYVVATRRKNIDNLVKDLHNGYNEPVGQSIRIHDSSSASYSASISDGWESAPDGVDVVSDRSLIRATFPALADDIRNVIHIRRAGDIDSQLLATYMLRQAKDNGCRRITGELKGISAGTAFEIDVQTSDGIQTIRADQLVNAAGPFAKNVAAMLDTSFPLQNTFQQKVAFEDALGAVPRNLPFSIDLDEGKLEWNAEEQQLLAEDPDAAWLTESLPGGRHCRPVGGDHGNWVKLGWAYNSDVSEPMQDLANEPKLDAQFPEIVIRGVSSLIPSLAAYIEAPPTKFSHYGGYYTMTEENWPLIGPMGPSGTFTVSALSGFGSMAACAAGSLCASWMCDGELPPYAKDLSPLRYSDSRFLSELRKNANKGLL